VNLERLVNVIKQHPDYHRVGMVLCHKGVVRGFARDGRPVSGLRVSVHRERLEQVLRKHRQREGILDILVEINADRDLAVGEEVMHLVVAGDIRETVIATLHATLDDIKTKVTRKTQYYLDQE
jgi:molybdopterin synthase catalytic subunit